MVACKNIHLKVKAVSVPTEQAVSLLNADTTSAEGATILTSQPMQRIITSGGERILTPHVGDGAGKTVGVIPRRMSASLVTGHSGTQTAEGPSARSGELVGLQQLPQQSGELDPQTGLFHSAGVAGQQIVVRDGSILTSQVATSASRQTPAATAELRQVSPVPSQVQPPSQVLSRTPNVVSVPVVSQPPNQPMDLLSSSLAQAQINLESFDFDDEGLDPYGPLDGDAGAVGVAGGGVEEELEGPQPLGVGEVVNFDAHTALLEESEAGAAEQMTDAQQGEETRGGVVVAVQVCMCACSVIYNLFRCGQECVGIIKCLKFVDQLQL